MVAIVLALFSACALVAIGDLRAAPVAAVGVLLAWGLGVVVLPRPRGSLRSVVACAAAVRSILLFSPASLSDDLYRYLWEGKVVAMGGNPYLQPPTDPAWALLADDPIRLLVNHPDVPSVYPPLALLGFSVLASLHYGPLTVKLAMGLADLVTTWALARVLQERRRALDGAWLYALLPLAAVETAGSGHLDGIAVAALALALLSWQRGGSGLGWAGLGALIKLLPVALLPALWRRRPGLLLGVFLLAGLPTMPFTDAGPALLDGLTTYAKHWRFNASVFAVLDISLGAAARPVAAVLGAAVAGWALLRFRDPARVALWIGGGFVLLSPTVHPWYLLWAWVPALLLGVRAWTVLAVLAPVSYVVFVGGGWTERTWPALVQYLPFGATLAWEAWRHLVTPGPRGPGAAPATGAA